MAAPAFSWPADAAAGATASISAAIAAVAKVLPKRFSLPLDCGPPRPRAPEGTVPRLRLASLLVPHPPARKVGRLARVAPERGVHDRAGVGPGARSRRDLVRPLRSARVEGDQLLEFEARAQTAAQL